MINKTDLFIFCDWLTDNNVDSGLLRIIVDCISSGIIGVGGFGVDIGGDCVGGDGGWFGFGYGYGGDGFGDGDGIGYGFGYGFGDGYGGDGFGDGVGCGFDLEYDE